jgi:hypothetical protein
MASVASMPLAMELVSRKAMAGPRLEIGSLPTREAYVRGAPSIKPRRAARTRAWSSLSRGAL